MLDLGNRSSERKCMITAKIAPAALVALALFAFSASAVHEIKLKNGRWITGDIVSENPNFFVIDRGGSEIRVLKTLIASIDGKPLGETGGANAAQEASSQNQTEARPHAPEAARKGPEDEREIILKNGTRFNGRIIAENPNFVTLDLSGTRLKIIKSLIQSLDGKPFGEPSPAETVAADRPEPAPSPGRAADLGNAPAAGDANPSTARDSVDTRVSQTDGSPRAAQTPAAKSTRAPAGHTAAAPNAHALSHQPSREKDVQKPSRIRLKNGTVIEGVIVARNASFYTVIVDGSSLKILRTMIAEIDGNTAPEDSGNAIAPPFRAANKPSAPGDGAGRRLSKPVDSTQAPVAQATDTARIAVDSASKIAAPPPASTHNAGAKVPGTRRSSENESGATPISATLDAAAIERGPADSPSPQQSAGPGSKMSPTHRPGIADSTVARQSPAGSPANPNAQAPEVAADSAPSQKAPPQASLADTQAPSAAAVAIAPAAPGVVLPGAAPAAQNDRGSGRRTSESREAQPKVVLRTVEEPRTQEQSRSSQQPTGATPETELTRLRGLLTRGTAVEQIKAALGAAALGAGAAALTHELIDCFENTAVVAQEHIEAIPGAEILEPPISPARAAARALGVIGAPAAEALEKAALHKKTAVRKHAIQALRFIETPRATRALVAALGDPDIDIQFIAQSAALERAPTPLLLAAAGDRNDNLRKNAIALLGELELKEAADAVAAALEDRNASVREKAALAAARIGDSRFVKSLTALLHDKISFVRANAAYALGELYAPEGVEPLIAALKDKSGIVRERAAFALGKLRDTRAIEPLSAASRDASPDVRDAVSEALELHTDIDLLIEALRDPRKVVRANAEYALFLMTGRDFGGDADRWQQWRSEQGQNAQTQVSDE